MAAPWTTCRCWPTTSTAAQRCAYSVGDFDGTLARTAESEAITEAIGNLWQLSYGRMIRTTVYLERGEVDQGIAEAEAAMRLAEAPALSSRLSISGCSSR